MPLLLILSRNVFDRLASPPRREEDVESEADSTTMDRVHHSFLQDEEDPEERFIDFLWRQNEHEFIRLERLRQIEEESKPPHQYYFPIFVISISIFS